MAGDLKTQLEVAVDGTGVTAGVNNIKKSLDTLGQKAVEVGKTASGGIENIGKGGDAAASKVDAATRNMVGSIQRQIAAMEAGTKSGADYYRVLAGQRGIDTNVLKPYLDQLDAVAAKQKTVGVSAAQTAAAMRGVPAQFTDIITSLQGGQAPITVLLQQGGQLKDMFGGAGAAAKALGGYVVGLINPFTVTAAAIGVLGVAAYKGAQEQSAYQRALILSGNAAGVTAGQLDVMAASLKDIGAGTQGQAAAALAALASTGLVGAANLQKFAATAIAVERTIGTSVADTARAFAELGEEPLKATEKLAKGTGYLTLALYDQIKALEDQGRKTEAAAVAQSAYDTAQATSAAKLKANLGSLETLMNGITGAASRMWDGILGVGRQASPEVAVSSAQRAVAALQATYDSRVSRGMATGDVKPQLDAAIATLNAQRASLETATKTAAAEGATAQIHREAVAARKDNAKWAEAALTATEKTNRALEVYRTNNAKIAADGGKLDARTVAAEEAAIRKANAGPKAAAVAKPKAYEDDAGTKYIQQLREQEAALQTRLTVGEKLTGAAKELAQFEQKIADLKGKGQLTKDQKELVGRQGEIRAILQEMGMLEKLGQIEDDEAKKKAKRAQEALAFQDRAAQLEEQIATAQAGRREAYERSLAGYGQSDSERQRIEAVNALYRESERYQAQLTKATPKDQLGSEGYLKAMLGIKSALDVSLADHAEYYANLKQIQGDWSLGAKSALATYADESANIAKQMKQATGSAFQGLEDQLVKFVTTGKADFKSLADFAVAELARIAIRKTVTGPLASAFEGLFKNADGGVYSSVGLSAYSGTIVSKPTVFPFARGAGLMGEAGPEAILPLKRGADGKLGVSSGSSQGSMPPISFNIDARGADAGVEQRLRAAMPDIVRQTTAAVQGLANRGGSFAKSVGRR